MLRSRGKVGVIVLWPYNGSSIELDRTRVVAEEEVVVEVVKEVEVDEDDREGFEGAKLLFFKILCNNCIAVMTS